jgi:hypothetical protein
MEYLRIQVAIHQTAENIEDTTMRQLMREKSAAAPPPPANPVRDIRRRYCEKKRCEIDEFDEFCTRTTVSANKINIEMLRK